MDYIYINFIAQLCVTISRSPLPFLLLVLPLLLPPDSCVLTGLAAAATLCTGSSALASMLGWTAEIS